MLETSARVGARDLNLSRHVLRHSASISADLWPFGVHAADDRSPAEDRKINDLSTFRDKEKTPVSRATIASSSLSSSWSSQSALSLRDPPVRAHPTEEALRSVSCYASAPESWPDLFPLINNTTRSNGCYAFNSFHRDSGQAIVFKGMALYLWAVTVSSFWLWRDGFSGEEQWEYFERYKRIRFADDRVGELVKLWGTKCGLSGWVTTLWFDLYRVF